MADKRKAVGGGWLTHTLHVWPTDEVVADSAYWPAWWDQAYDQAARRIADVVACCILGGLPDCPEPIRMELQPSGSLTFSVHLSGTTIEVFIWAFEGPDDPEPDAPGPNGGVRRKTADGLVLGLRGVGKEFSVARFYDGLAQPIPAGRDGRVCPWVMRVTTAARTAGAQTRRFVQLSSPIRAPSGAAMSRMAAPKKMQTGRGRPVLNGVRVVRDGKWSPPGSANGDAPTCSTPVAIRRAAIAIRREMKAEIGRTHWMNTRRKQTLSRFARIDSGVSTFERCLELSDICGAGIPDPHFCLRKQLSADASTPRLN
jgi:hypothetical protein